LFKINPKLLIIFPLIILAISIFFLKNFRIDASSDTLVSQNDLDFKYYNYYSKLFKSDNFLIIAVENNNVINLNFIENIKSISTKISDLDGVKNVFSFLDAPIFFLNETTLQSLQSSNIETILNTNYELLDVINEFKSNPIYKDQIVNNKGNVFSIIIYLKNNYELINARKDYKDSIITKNNFLEIKNKSDIKRNNLIIEIRDIIKQSSQNYNYFLGGIEMISNDVINFVKNDIFVFSISVLILITSILFFILKRIKWVLICISSSIYTVILIFGLLGLIQIEVTAISSNFAALIFILSISMNIHIINYYRLLDNTKTSKLKITISNMFWPCLYTSLTTIIAFASLVITDIKPVIDFGLIMILSLTVSLISSFVILPILISIFPDSNSNKLSFVNFSFVNNLTNLHFKKIVLISFILFFSSFIGLKNLSVENSFVNYFKKNTEIYKGMKLIDEELGGTTPLDVILTFNDNELLFKDENNDNIIDDDILNEDIFSDDLFSEVEEKNWFTIEKLDTISKIHSFLENRKEIGKVQSIVSIIELANQINQKPLDIFELSILYNEVPENYKQSLIYPYLLTENNMVRITARVKDSKKIIRKNLINDINLFIESNRTENLERFRVNGLLVLYNNMLDSLFESQFKSFAFVIMIIFIMFLILFKSIKLSVIGIIPNIFSAFFILGIIGFLKIPLDIMTITIAAITIGIAVDNTIHYLYRYKQFNKSHNVIKSIKMTNESAGLAVLITSITIAIGFSILCLSNFIPTVIFGIFTSLAMIFAMSGVLILIPSLLKFYQND
tara:strand:- start:685 stop:3057 length:2373 start_codon:yes stop_codon:yes gene_type:complete